MKRFVAAQFWKIGAVPLWLSFFSHSASCHPSTGVNIWDVSISHAPLTAADVAVIQNLPYAVISTSSQQGHSVRLPPLPYQASHWNTTVDCNKLVP